MPSLDHSQIKTSIGVKPIIGSAAGLKEWAIVCKALEEGRQVILLRKGGIMEYKYGFEVKHSNFFLYPTYEHQSKESLQPDYADKLDIVLQNTPRNNRNRISSCATAIQVMEITDEGVLGRLEKYHIWNDRYVNTRMRYNPKKPMNIVVLRVYKMNNPIEVDIEPELTGCRSWVPIRLYNTNLEAHQNSQHGYDKQSTVDIIDADFQPVFNDSEFKEIVKELQELSIK
jgi:hypothetical protein